MRLRAPGRPPRALLVAAVLAAASALIPLGYLVGRVVGGGSSTLESLISRPRLPMLVGNTLLLAITVTLTSLVIGLAFAHVLARVGLRLRPALMMCAALPLAVPSYLSAYGLLAWFPQMQGFWASWLVLTAVSVPYVTLPVAAAMRASTRAYEDVARSLGRNAVSAQIAGTWHQIRGAAGAGALLVFLYAIADFGGVALFRFPVLTTSVYQAYGSSYDRSYAALLGLILVAIAIVVVLAERRARGRLGGEVDVRTIGRNRLIRFAPRHVPAAILGLLPVTVAVVLPVVAMIQRMLGADALADFDATRFWGALATTVLLSLAGALVALVLATPIAILSARYRSRLVGVIESVGYLPLALPGIVVGLALVFFALSAVPALYQTALLLALAYGLLYMPKAIGTIRSRLKSIPSSLEDVAATQGYWPLQVWAHVLVPLSQSSFVLAALLVGVTVMKELPATLMLRPTGMDTLATMLWSRTDVAAYGAAAPYALALVVVATIPAYFLSRDSHIPPEDS